MGKISRLRLHKAVLGKGKLKAEGVQDDELAVLCGADKQHGRHDFNGDHNAAKKKEQNSPEEKSK